MTIDPKTFGWFGRKGETVAHLMDHSLHTSSDFSAVCGVDMHPFSCISPWPKELPDEYYTICEACLASYTMDLMRGA